MHIYIYTYLYHLYQYLHLCLSRKRIHSEELVHMSVRQVQKLKGRPAVWRHRQDFYATFSRQNFFFSGKPPPQVLPQRPLTDWMRPTPIMEGPLFYLKLSDCRCCPCLSTKYLRRIAETSVWWIPGDSRPSWHQMDHHSHCRCHGRARNQVLCLAPLEVIGKLSLLAWHTPGVLAPGTDCGGWGWVEEDDLSDWGA